MGDWKCRACGETTKARYTPDKCGHCGADGKALRYAEILMRCPDTGIVGSPDILFDMLANGRKTIIEIKSEGADAFKARTAPTEDHVTRTCMYLWLAERTPWLAGKGIATDEARIVYACLDTHVEDPRIKAWKLSDAARTPYKEYVVKRNDARFTAALEKVGEWLTYRAALEYGDAPDSVPLPDRVCRSAGCSRARRCSVAALCFPGGKGE